MQARFGINQAFASVTHVAPDYTCLTTKSFPVFKGFKPKPSLLILTGSNVVFPSSDLYQTVRSAAPYAELSRPIFDGVLDMLSGRYPSDEFAELRPRVTWDRVNGLVTARQGAKRVAIANAGTIPDRGLYGVFLTGADKDKARVGELDEEMVFEARAGERFLLGASTWRIDQITHDRVLVSPAPGEPGKMPFWRGEGPGRPVELGIAIGKLVRELRAAPRTDALRSTEDRRPMIRPAGS